MKKFCDLLWTIRTVQEYESKYLCRITRSYLLRILEESFLGGRKTKSQPVLELLLRLKLLGINDEHQMFVMPRGIDLSESGEEGGYELNLKQRMLMTSWYVSVAGEVSKKWLEYFIFTDLGEQKTIRSLIPKPLQQWTEEMLYLGVVVQTGELLELLGEQSWMRAYPIKQPSMTLEELQAILKLQAEAGRNAEEFVLHFEKKRLQQLGLVREGSCVECISDRLVNAGYDIVSFSTSALKPEQVY